ncbi:MAG: hypothetical protein ACPHK8_01305 [Thermoplasmatota archaeon]
MERSKGSLVFCLLVAGMVVGALFLPWFHYEENSGRNTAPDGPYGEHKRVQYVNHTFSPFGDEGDIEGHDAGPWLFAILLTSACSAGLLVLAALGDIRGIDRVIGRRTSLALQAIGWLGITGSLALAWHWLPQSLAPYGVTKAFTYTLHEPVGYTRTDLGYGWMLTGIAWFGVPIAWIRKFQAGSDDPTDVEAYRV